MDQGTGNGANSLVRLRASNMFSYTGENPRYSTPVVTPPAVAQPNSVLTSEERGCGFEHKHIEMINMPAIGPMMFVGVQYNR